VPAPEDVAAPPKGAQRTESALSSRVLKQGTGTDRAKRGDCIKVHYTGWTKDGRMFDGSVTQGEPAKIMLNHRPMRSKY
jgi:peptidylprolyl isomerase